MATSTTTFRKTTLSHAQKTVLAMSRAQYLDVIRTTRPADRLYVGVCIFKMDAHSSRPSVLLLRRSASSTTSNPISAPTRSASRWRRRSKPPQQNSSSNSSSSERVEGEEWMGYDEGGGRGGGGRRDGTARNGSCWELPGGKVRDSDFCISAAVARRVVEQTGLRVVRILGALQDVRRTSEVRILDWDDDGAAMFADDDPAEFLLDGATLTSSSTPTPPPSTTTPSTPTTLGSGSGSSRNSSSRNNRDSRPMPMHNPQLVLRRECLQLNYAVLVQSYDDLRVNTGDHDELVWASFSRAEAMRLPEQLRTVVHQGLAFAGEYLF